MGKKNFRPHHQKKISSETPPPLPFLEIFFLLEIFSPHPLPYLSNMEPTNGIFSHEFLLTHVSVHMVRVITL